jgi:hypothetical protein
MCLQFGFVIFWQNNFGTKAAHKMLVKLTPGRPLQPSPMFVSKAGAYPSVEQQKSASLGKEPALPVNIRLGWKVPTGTNTLAYYVHL